MFHAKLCKEYFLRLPLLLTLDEEYLDYAYYCPVLGFRMLNLYLRFAFRFRLQARFAWIPLFQDLVHDELFIKFPQEEKHGKRAL